MTKEKTDLFLTHDWGKDEKGRSNHDRVAVINDALKEIGYSTWFDSDRMTGCIVDQMCWGIDNTRLVLVFVTQRYAQKVAGTNGNDNCKLEFNYAMRKKGVDNLIPIIMEERMKTPADWSGGVGLTLGGMLAVRMFFDFDDAEKLKMALEALKKEIDVRLKNLNAAVPSKPVSITTLTRTVSVLLSAAKNETQPKIITVHDIIYGLSYGMGEGIFIKKFDGQVSKFLYVRKDKHLDLKDTSFDTTWFVKPKRQHGMTGFSINVTREGVRYSLVMDQDSGKVLLSKGNPHEYEEEVDDFWAIIPTSEDNAKQLTFRIVNMRGGTRARPMVASRHKAGYYNMECKDQGKKIENALWVFEGMKPGIYEKVHEKYKEVYRRAIMADRSVKIYNASQDQWLTGNKDKGTDTVKLSVSLSSDLQNLWDIFPWKENKKDCYIISLRHLRKDLAYDGSKVAVRDNNHDAGYQNSKWELIPLKDDGKDSATYKIRKCFGADTGRFLAADANSGDVICVDGDDKYTTTWTLQLC